MHKAIFFDRDGTLIKTNISSRNTPISIKTKKEIKEIRHLKMASWAGFPQFHCAPGQNGLRPSACALHGLQGRFCSFMLDQF